MRNLNWLPEEVGVVAVFGGDGGLGAVAGIDGGVGREVLDEVFEGVDERPVVAAGEVCAAYGELEEAVAGEEHLLFLAVVADAAGGVAGAGDDGEAMVAEGDDGVLGDGLAGRTCGALHGMTEDEAHLLLGMEEGVEVGGVATGGEMVAGVDVGGIPEVVEMGVRQEMGHRAQVVVGDVVGNGAALIVVVGAAVDDDGLAGVVADDVAVLAEWIDGEGFDDHIEKPPSPLKGSVGNEEGGMNDE